MVNLPKTQVFFIFGPDRFGQISADHAISGRSRTGVIAGNNNK